MSERKFVTRRTVLLTVLAILLIISGIVFSVGSKDNKNVATGTSDHTQHASANQSEEAKVESATTTDVDDPEDQTESGTTGTPPAQVASAATSTPKKKQPTTTAPTATPEIPQNENPVPEEEAPEEEPADEPEEELNMVFVPVSGSSDSFTLETTDGSVFRWFPACPATWNGETLPEDKPLADMYMVLEDPQVADGHVGSSVSFHVRAQDFAIPGDEFECGFYVMDDTTGDVFTYTFTVVIVPADFEVEEL
ncbi:MAG TPA: hypothetical protein VK674_00010 [Candidatus Limnocylindria bacterium]|nr:hypothetical protein [Candidatus Limnocylindria bacterium]